MTAKHYHTLLEKLAQLQTDKSDGRLYALFNQLDFIRGSLQQITPGTAHSEAMTITVMALPAVVMGSASKPPLEYPPEGRMLCFAC